MASLVLFDLDLEEDLILNGYVAYQESAKKVALK